MRLFWSQLGSAVMLCYDVGLVVVVVTRKTSRWHQGRAKQSKASSRSSRKSNGEG